MKKTLRTFMKRLGDFVEMRQKPTVISLKSNKISTTIKLAQTEQLALHVIYSDRSFTGDLVKYDKKEGKLILKNFQKNMSVIIPIEKIDRLTTVPPTIRKSQLQHVSKK